MIAAIFAAATLAYQCELPHCAELIPSPSTVHNIGLETVFRTPPKPGSAYLSDMVAANAYDAAKRDPAAFCAAFRLVAYMQLPGEWQERWAPESDEAEFNGETLVCPRDLTQPPRWEHLK